MVGGNWSVRPLSFVSTCARLSYIPSVDALRAADVLVDGDKPWQAELRLRQSLRRERLGIPAGLFGNRQIGSRLPAVIARTTFGRLAWQRR
ncbi:MAG: hypothetical protein WD794_10960 [Mycobacteriales bacterium]